MPAPPQVSATGAPTAACMHSGTLTLSAARCADGAAGQDWWPRGTLPYLAPEVFEAWETHRNGGVDAGRPVKEALDPNQAGDTPLRHLPKTTA